MRTRSFLIAFLALALPQPAAAHGISSSARLETTVDAVEPVVAGLRVEATREAGRLRVVNGPAGPVEVLGAGGGTVLRVPAGATRTWHDRRAEPARMPSGGKRRRVLDWRIPLRADGREATVRGHVVYVPPRRSPL